MQPPTDALETFITGCGPRVESNNLKFGKPAEFFDRSDYPYRTNTDAKSV